MPVPNLRLQAELRRLGDSVERWIDFYAPYFADAKSVEAFVAQCQAQRPPNQPAKIMLHQARRLVSIADEMPKIRPAREALQLLFLIACAENIAKLADGYSDDGKSRLYVQKFFAEYIRDDDRQSIEHSFFNEDGVPLDLETVVGHLYSVRCDVVHEGRYWDFSFRDGSTDMVNARPPIEVRMPYTAFRDVVVRTAIGAINRCLVDRGQAR